MNPKQLQKLMKEAQRMQEQLQNQMLELKVDAASGGGMVSVQMDGNKQLLSIKIDPQAVDPADVEMLQDLIVAAVNEAGRKVDAALNSQVTGIGNDLLGNLG
ncbi:MAG: YbaB/EbfC family nucleoid-associated protein [Acidobacteria bacterium]|nr:MAG: YbaB/EbfC family nucleoid-associated protein [Acidobacteriota bacterium]